MFIRYQPINSIKNVAYFKDDITGIDWYKYVGSLPKDKTIIMVNKENFIITYGTDATYFTPNENFKIYIIETGALPAGFNTIKEWFYIDDKFLKLTDHENYIIYKKNAEYLSKKEKLKDDIFYLECKNRLGLLSITEKSGLTELYIEYVNLIDNR